MRKPSDLLHVKASLIEIRLYDGIHELRIGEATKVRASRKVDTNQRVSCVVPGHHQPGTELYADEQIVRDEPFRWELAGNCAFVTEFDYRSDE